MGKIESLISGVKRFLKFPYTPASTPQDDYHVANKKYVDDKFNGITQSETGVTDFDIVIENGLIKRFTKN